jgi:[NiFe] hydrogenase assembly HybE family chaperone
MTAPRSPFAAPPQGGRDPRCSLGHAVEVRARVAQRVTALEALFAHIAATRMAGIPILHPGLQVEAVGFEPQGDEGAVGVLVTPWFMNLVWLPLSEAPTAETLAVRATRERQVGRERFAFIGAYEDGFGAFEACSLFSPMGDFVDHAAAVATARAVLEELRKPPEPPPAAPMASRRALLFGRTGGATEAAP